MGIRTSGAQSLPQKPTPLNVDAVSYFDDFLYTGPSLPFDFSGSNMLFGNPAGIDPAHPGVIYGDVTNTTPAFIFRQQGATQGFNLGLFATVDIEWMWQLNQDPGAAGYQWSMGPNTGNGCFAATGSLAIQSATPNGTCANMTSANLWLASNDGVTSHYTDLGVTLASIFGLWVKSRISWSRATGNVTVFHNDVLKLTTNSNLPTGLAQSAPWFEFNSFRGGVIAAGTRLLFDYLKINATLAR